MPTRTRRRGASKMDKLKALGRKKRDGRKASTDAKALVLEIYGEAYEKGMSPEQRGELVKEMASALGCSDGRIYQIIAPGSDDRGRRAS